MHKHVLRTLLFIVGAAFVVFFFWRYHIHALIFAWFWSIREVGMVIGETFLFRRIMRPLSTVVTRVCIIVVFGYGVEGRWRNRFLGMIWNFNEFIMIMWHGIPRTWRAVAFLAVGATSALGIWIHWQILLFVPLAASLFRKLDYWLGDRFFDRWFWHLRFKYHYHRFMHRQQVMRFFRRPRHWYAILLKEIEVRRERRLERWRKRRTQRNGAHKT